MFKFTKWVMKFNNCDYFLIFLGRHMHRFLLFSFISTSIFNIVTLFFSLEASAQELLTGEVKIHKMISLTWHIRRQELKGRIEDLDPSNSSNKLHCIFWRIGTIRWKAGLLLGSSFLIIFIIVAKWVIGPGESRCGGGASSLNWQKTIWEQNKSDLNYWLLKYMQRASLTRRETTLY